MKLAITVQDIKKESEEIMGLRDPALTSQDLEKEAKAIMGEPDNIGNAYFEMVKRLAG